MKSFKEKKYK